MQTLPDDMYCPQHANQRDWFGRRLSMARTCPKCPWLSHVQGKHPQTGEDVDSYTCAIAHGPLLAMEIAKGVRGVQQAVEARTNKLIELAAQGIVEQRQQHAQAVGLADERARDAPKQLTDGASGVQMNLPIEAPVDAEIEAMS